jgi:phage/conjugal plasmid C-4 type zinc finger TraR family protein
VDESDYERAAKLAQGEIDTALAKHKQQMASRGSGASECEECGFEIPPARRKAVNADLCIECQSLKEQKERHWA